jgi:hypothetical protein
MTPDASLSTRLADADPRIIGFLEVWRDARAGRLVPMKRDIDPTRFPTLLPFIWLYRLEPTRGDFVCRLAGESVNDAWGRSIRGRALEEIVGEADYPTIRERWERILSVPQVQYGTALERLSAMSSHRAERLLVPLTSDDGVRDQILGISLYRFDGTSPSRRTLVPEDITLIPCQEL